MPRNCSFRITRVRTALSISTAVVLLVAGCISGTADRSVIEKPEAVPSINLLTPRAGQTLPADDVEVQVEIDGFTVDAKAMGGAVVAGRGHWHFYLDGEFMHDSAQSRIMLDPLPSGPHQMRVALINNDHSPLIPSIEDSVMVDIIVGEEVVPTKMDPDF